MLNSLAALLTVEITSPMNDVLKVKLEHFKVSSIPASMCEAYGRVFEIVILCSSISPTANLSRLSPV